MRESNIELTVLPQPEDLPVKQTARNAEAPDFAGSHEQITEVTAPPESIFAARREIYCRDANHPH
jgi:hypothetical protein